MLTFRQICNGLRQLELDAERPVIAHASLSSFGEVQGGAETVVGALLSVVSGLMMPAFTYQTMIVPEVGPPDNGMVYGNGQEANQMAEFFEADLPVDPLMGAIAEALRKHPAARRSTHPILSFSGVNLDHILATQTLEEPLAPIAALSEAGGSVLLIGVDQRANTAIHYAEKLAGLKRFIRWALTPAGIIACPEFPGSSEGFQKIVPHIESCVRQTTIGSATVQAIPLMDLITKANLLLEEDPFALLPDESDDLRVQAARDYIAAHLR